MWYMGECGYGECIWVNVGMGECGIWVNVGMGERGYG